MCQAVEDMMKTREQKRLAAGQFKYPDTISPKGASQRSRCCI